ncbi:PQQ-dependent sugar dehydrogenase [Deinococcus pimensis]|uniref:PQQ-dependent sugar dehydrogenase n=1 Tax=Deinococcus pimensis TaxID=309888 RepID=UPI00048261D1|nr:PQQ-dependent sugar dehydrogenase [Deinococcus pimensis]
MRNVRALLGAALALSALLTIPVVAQNNQNGNVRLTRVVTGLERPVTVTNAGDGSGRLFVVEQGGRVRVVKDGRLQPGAFLDLSGLTRAGGERGLLGLAFDPKFRQNGRLFVNYTDRDGNTVIARYTAKGDAADPRSATVLLRAEQPYANHNGGQLAFGPDGYLYVGLGDGGSGGDPQNNGQNLGTFLGKVLRVDVSGEKYAVPRDNPFVNREGARPEIWAYGLRNPWRFSFDRRTGDLLIADVGQNRFEEVNFQPKASRGGENYGWRLKEGDECFDPSSNCARGTLVDPVVTYGRSEGQSITGGYVYRGKALPDLVGRYVYGDFASGRVWAASRASNGRWTTRELLDTNDQISTFGEDEAGELYVADYGSGTLLRFGK